MNKDILLTEQLLNEIFIAFQYGRDFCQPSKELISTLATLTGKTELVMEEHYKIIQKMYTEGKLNKKKLTPHLPS